MRYKPCLLLAMSLSIVGSAAHAEDLALEPSQPAGTPCCGALQHPERESLLRSRTPRASGTEGCVCLKYIYAQWGNGTCTFYATDCYGAPFAWDDLCSAPHPGNCDETSCGTCFYIPEQPVPRMAGEHPLPAKQDHAVEPILLDEAGATFFESPFFVRVNVPERDAAIRAKVFPILVSRRTVDGQTLPAQVFYQGVEVEEFPADAKARPVLGRVAAQHQCEVIDHGRVLQIRTHSKLTGK